MKQHLIKCQVYLNECITNGIHNDITKEAAVAGRSQNKIPFPTLSKAQIDALDIAAAAVCVIEGQPFTLFESPSMQTFLHLLNPVYTPPGRDSIRGPLLDTIYTDIKRQTDALIFAMPWLNVITDESSNINKARICNLSVHSVHGSLHYLSEDIGAKRMDSVGAAKWLKDKLDVLTNGDLSKINSIATDTCSTMYKMWLELQKFPEFAHCFFIPCDSHGLQLLVKDILKIPCFKLLHDKAKKVVRAFRKAHLQLARLRDIQLSCYNEHRALILSIITRWGTQLRLIASLLNSKVHLHLYYNLLIEGSYTSICY